jgi:hypothetical protein
MEINALTAQIVHSGTVISLQGQKIEAREALVLELQKQIASNGVISKEQKQKLKHRIRTLWKWVIVEGGVIITIAILVLI